MSQAHKTQLSLLLLVPLALTASCRSQKPAVHSSSVHTISADSLHWTEDYLRRFTMRTYSDITLSDTTSFVWTLSPDSSALVPAMITHSARLTADEATESADTASLLGSGMSATELTGSMTAEDSGTMTEGKTQRAGQSFRTTRRLCLLFLAAGFVLGLMLSARLRGVSDFFRSLFR